ncbi:prepilin-type N-terminal cleavage/methylation domain-containing protein [Nostocaceae cyanobacterium CENA369]|uniref:Prepilin-type N-terminal cleavage/methylation domain-containing protein n=1 Tax=Dendronalium phyllosphericum CENA369 TaxID=1725256 RepID=A0A8J7I6S0_9NOST|nr:prepilin-type N-terminal cleavage/methylation domain-containing protein [Dendronalium phyllosphericum CENA369]
MKNISNNCSSSGFSLPEILVTIVAIGILIALALPNWQSFMEVRRLTAAQEEIYQSLKQAQNQAAKEKVTWQTSFRQNNNIVQWTVHKAEQGQFIPVSVMNNDKVWYEFHPNIRIDLNKNNKDKYETTLPKHSSQQVWRVLFNYQGCPIYEVGDECTDTSLRTLGQITLYSHNSGKVRRCVYVSTIIGAVKMGKEHSRANEKDKYCY